MSKALVITDRIITPSFDGASLRMLHLLRILRDEFNTVALLPLFEESWPPFDRTLQSDRSKLLAEQILLPSGDALEHLKACGRDYSLIIFSGFAVANRLLPPARTLAPHARLIFDTVDLRHLREFREAKISGNANVLKRALQSKRTELELTKLADATFVVSPIERDILSQADTTTPIALISNIHLAERPPDFAAQRETLLFVGIFQHSPNIDAALFLAQEIWPEILKINPTLRLDIVGADAPESLQRLAGGSITFTGQVDDLQPLFDSAVASVAPLRFGAGVKGKVLESMARGVPVVATSIAAEGIQCENGDNILLAETPAEFAGQISALRNDSEYWRKISGRAQQTIEQYFSPTVVGLQLRQCLSELLGATR